MSVPAPIAWIPHWTNAMDPVSTLPHSEFVVLKDSYARVREIESISEGVSARRSELTMSGVLVRDGDRFRFTEDWSFGTATAAAAVVVGASINGRTSWKLVDGTTFGDWEARRLGLSDRGPRS